MDVKVLCLFFFIACAYGSFLPSSLTSAVKPITDVIDEGEKFVSQLAGGKQDKSSDDSSEKSGEKSGEKSDEKSHEGSHEKSHEKSGEKPKKEEKEVGKLVKQLSHVSEKLLHAVDLQNPQAKNLVLSIKALVDQLVRQEKEGQLKVRERRDLGDVLGSLSKAISPHEEKPQGNVEDVVKLLKILRKVVKKLIEILGKDNTEARNILLSIEKLADQLSSLTEGKNRPPRDLGDITKTVSELLGQNGFSELLNLIPLGSNVTAILSKVDFSKVKEVPKIPSLQEVDKLPVLPGLRENVLYARNLTRLALGGIGEKDLPTVIQKATEKAIHSLVPVGALTAMLSTILHIYYDIAVNSPLYVVGAAVLQDGLMTIAAVVKSVVSVIASDIKNIVSG